jgi:hypothetical protein
MDNTLLLSAFVVFSVAVILIYLVAIWLRPLWAWLLTGLGAAATIGCFAASEAQARAALASTATNSQTPGLALLILAAICGIATAGGLVGAGYGTWRFGRG